MLIDFEISRFQNFNHHLLEFYSHIYKIPFKILRQCLKVILIIFIILLSPLIYGFSFYILYKCSVKLKKLNASISQMPTDELQALSEKLIKSNAKKIEKPNFKEPIILKPLIYLIDDIDNQFKLIQDNVDNQIKADLQIFEMALETNVLIGQ